MCRAPLYPSKSVKFEIGFSKNTLQPVPGQHQVQLIDSPQTFLLPANAPAGHYLKVIMCGKFQQQFEDRQYFTAIRRVTAVGRCIPSAVMLKAHRLLQSRQLCLSQLFTMPATTEQHIFGPTSCCRQVHVKGWCAMFTHAMLSVPLLQTMMCP